MVSRSAILTWHSLDDSGSVISTPPQVFRRQIESLAKSGIPVVALDRALSCPGSVALTFDDGCRNLAEHAFPLLDRFGFPATVFVVSGYCGRSNNWPTQPRGSVPELPLLSWAQLAELPAFISIGAHTATHPDLTRLSDEECAEEMRKCRDEIEQRLARPAPWLAYPYGACSERVRVIAARYFDLAVGTSLRFLSPRAATMDLPRLDMFYFRGELPLERLFTPAAQIYIGARRVVREARRRLMG